jgi:alginate O-acetyltransferase complex protein AlgI
VLYDGECSICRRAAHRLAPVLKPYRFTFAPLQTPWVQIRLGLASGTPLTEMALLTDDGRAFGGAEAIVEIARRIWWAWPLFAFARLPGVQPVLDAAYRFIAIHRNCSNGACRLHRRHYPEDWLLLIALPTGALLVRDRVPAWVFMWLMSAALFMGCKWLTWRRAVRAGGANGRLVSLGYLFAWIGMDARAFLGRRDCPAPRLREWIFAATKLFAGIVVVWFAGKLPIPPLASGWLCLLGFILCLHFGSFQLLALAWRRANVNARPLMDAPTRAVSIAEFWGRRWNSAFHLLVHDLAFKSLARRCGVARATLLVFLISGLVHELVISFPARGGYGLPTAYFLLQGAGVSLERTHAAKRFGSGRGWRGWLFTMIVVAGPAFWLFHPTFIRNVILPMLHAIGAT